MVRKTLMAVALGLALPMHVTFDVQSAQHDIETAAGIANDVFETQET